MMKIGCVPACIEAVPRMRMFVEVPAAPDGWMSVMPGVRAWSSCATVLIGVCSATAATSSCVMELPSARFVAAPGVPVTTSASREMALCASVKSSVPGVLAVTVMVCAAVLKPTIEARTVCAPSGTLARVYSPAALVSAPRVVPSTTTCTPLSGRWLPASTTLPRMVPVSCAASGTAAVPRTAARAVNLRTARMRTNELLICFLLLYRV